MHAAAAAAQDITQTQYSCSCTHQRHAALAPVWAESDHMEHLPASLHHTTVLALALSPHTLPGLECRSAKSTADKAPLPSLHSHGCQSGAVLHVLAAACLRLPCSDHTAGPHLAPCTGFMCGIGLLAVTTVSQPRSRLSSGRTSGPS